MREWKLLDKKINEGAGAGAVTQCIYRNGDRGVPGRLITLLCYVHTLSDIVARPLFMFTHIHCWQNHRYSERFE